MLNDGKKEERKYCGSLEALVWLARDLELDQLTPFFASNSLDQQYRLIQQAWRQSTTSNKYASDRWKDFDEVVDRLNSWNLICIYVEDNIPWGPSEGSNREHGYWWGTPQEVFESKMGYCYEQSGFALNCLIKNGYSATTSRILFVRWGALPWSSDGDITGKCHAVTVSEKAGNYYAINLGKSTGPFDSFDKLKMSASSGLPVLGYKWFTYDSIPFHTPEKDIYLSLVDT